MTLFNFCTLVAGALKARAQALSVLFLSVAGFFFLTPLSLFAGHFDKDEFDLSGSLDTPMNTIAGLTDWAKSINEVYGITAIITVFIFFAVSIPVVYTVIRFRERPDDDGSIPKQVHGNPTLEFIWTVIPVVLLIFIAIPTWKSIFEFSDKARNPGEGALIVEAIGHQWWWEFRYPDLGITTANEVHLPENTPIRFKISSVDVIHSFWIPQFGGKVDALPGEGAENYMYFTTPAVNDPNKKGGDYYQGQCVELCGLSHALMRFQAVIHTKDEFNRWAEVYNEPPKVVTSLEKKGEEVFNMCMGCHTISGTLSASITVPKEGPDLSNFGDRRYLGAGTRRNTFENLAEWLDDPPAIKPGSKMLKLGLSQEDIEAVSHYIRNTTAKKF